MATKELFNQSLKTEIDDSDHIAVGLPGVEGGENILGSNLKKQMANWNILTETFTNGDLSSGTLSINHAKNTTIIRITIYTPAGYEENTAGIVKIVDADNVDIEFGGNIDAGDWRYILEYILI